MDFGSYLRTILLGHIANLAQVLLPNMVWSRARDSAQLDTYWKLFGGMWRTIFAFSLRLNIVVCISYKFLKQNIYNFQKCKIFIVYCNDYLYRKARKCCTNYLVTPHEKINSYACIKYLHLHTHLYLYTNIHM